MYKKRDLTIDTEFFEDHLRALEIPEAIRVEPSSPDADPFHLALQSDFSEEGWAGRGQTRVARRMQAANHLQKVLSEIQVKIFCSCWEQLKSLVIGRRLDPIFNHMGHIEIQESQRKSRHRRISPLEQEVLKLDSKREVLAGPNLSGLTISQVQRHTRAMRNQRQRSLEVRLRQRGNSSDRNHHEAELTYSRAKILQDIVQKLRKAGRGEIQIEQRGLQSTSSHQLLRKLGNLEKMVGFIKEEGSRVKIKSQKKQRRGQPFRTDYLNILRSELTGIKREIQGLRTQSQSIFSLQAKHRRQMEMLNQQRQEFEKGQQQMRRSKQQLLLLKGQMEAGKAIKQASLLQSQALGALDKRITKLQQLKVNRNSTYLSPSPQHYNPQQNSTFGYPNNLSTNTGTPQIPSINSGPSFYAVNSSPPPLIPAQNPQNFTGSYYVVNPSPAHTFPSVEAITGMKTQRVSVENHFEAVRNTGGWQQKKLKQQPKDQSPSTVDFTVKKQEDSPCGCLC